MATILFSTTDLHGQREREFAQLLTSIGRNAASGADMRLYVLVQNCTPAELAALREQVPPCCRLTAIEGRCSLSTARNGLIGIALAEAAPGRDDVVGFPDDDCWYPDLLVPSLTDTFAALPDLDILLCRVARQPSEKPVAAEEVRPAAVREVVRLSTSNSLFLRGSAFLRVGAFDPELGVGTVNGGGEDTDYAIRALLTAGQAGLIDRALVAHPEPDLASAAKYYRGALIVLARHARRRPALMFEFLRKILVGCYFVSRRRLSPRLLLAALGAAARNVSPPAPPPLRLGSKAPKV
ncbi:glycosyltransferase family 2 protein [Labrys portucalensis]|uniref:Glycosyltransferase family 2 protein n=1 Tax=Labrys neptuniae TaxID=376174 RepID=A0ABV6ZQD6_9HYPH